MGNDVGPKRVGRIGCIRSIQLHNMLLVSAGSIMSCKEKDSARDIGDCPIESWASSSARFASGSGAAAISR